MKLLPIFKVAKNKKFNFTPRYYDPIKEEIKERTEAIRRQLEGGIDTETFRSNKSGAFSQRSRRHSSANVLQFSFIIVFVTVVIAYLYFGPVALYSFLILLPLYVLIKLRKNI